MKYFGKLTMMAALTLALILGVAAFAESVAPEAPELPAVEATAPETTAPEQPAADAGTSATANDEALKAALDAYHEARDAERQQRLEDELKGFVEAGKLTQEQADLILEHLKDGEARHDGMGRGNKGGRMGGKGNMPNNGNMNGNGNMPNNGNMNGNRGGRFGQQMPNQQQMPNNGNGPRA